MHTKLVRHFLCSRILEVRLDITRCARALTSPPSAPLCSVALSEVALERCPLVRVLQSECFSLQLDFLKKLRLFERVSASACCRTVASLLPTAAASRR